jgi:hypothetical protein
LSHRHAEDPIDADPFLSPHRREHGEREHTTRRLQEALGAEAFEATIAAGKALDAEAG